MRGPQKGELLGTILSPDEPVLLMVGKKEVMYLIKITKIV